MPVTDADMAAADAAYAADPGTTPNGWSFIPEDELQSGWRNKVEAKLDLWRPEMTWFRLTDTTGEFDNGSTPAGIWIEAWKERPHKQAAFHPPLVESPAQ